VLYFVYDMTNPWPASWWLMSMAEEIRLGLQPRIGSKNGEKDLKACDESYNT
jgi:hypothetical protein